MRKIILLVVVFFWLISSVFAVSWDIDIIQDIEVWKEVIRDEMIEDTVLPKDLTFTDRYIIADIRDLWLALESLRRDLYKEIQNKQLESVDKALSYSANTVNFLFILFTFIAMILWLVGWKTFSDIKKSFKDNMEKEIKKLVKDFEHKIAYLEDEQKVNILWRQFNLADSDKDKLGVLNEIHRLRPGSKTVDNEKSNIYLSMGLYEQAVEIANLVLASKRIDSYPQAYFNRASAYAKLWEKDKAISDLIYLLQISPNYKNLVKESDSLSLLLSDKRVKEMF